MEPLTPAQIANGFLHINDLNISRVQLFEGLAQEIQATRLPAKISATGKSISVHVTPLGLDAAAKGRMVKVGDRWRLEFVFNVPDMDNEPREVARLYLDEEGRLCDHEEVQIASVFNRQFADQICQFVMSGVIQSPAFNTRPLPE